MCANKESKANCNTVCGIARLEKQLTSWSVLDLIGYAAASRHHAQQLALSVYRLVQDMPRKAQSNHIVGRGKAWQVCSCTNTRECSDILLQVQLSTSALPHPTPRLRALPSEGSCSRIATKLHRPEGHGKIENVAAFVVGPSIACIPMLS